MKKGFLSRNSVKIVRDGLRLGNVQRRDAPSFDGNYPVLVLQSSFNEQELLGRKHETVLLKQIGIDDGIGDPGFIFQTEKNKTFGCSRTLARNDSSGNA